MPFCFCLLSLLIFPPQLLFPSASCKIFPSSFFYDSLFFSPHRLRCRPLLAPAVSRSPLLFCVPRRAFLFLSFCFVSVPFSFSDRMIKPTAVFFFFLVLELPLAAHFHASFVVHPFARAWPPSLGGLPAPRRARLAPDFSPQISFLYINFESLLVHAIELTHRS